MAFSAVLDSDVLYRVSLRGTLLRLAELIVTLDLTDFPPAVCEPLGVDAIHPDELLLDRFDLNPEAVRAALDHRPPS